MVNKIPLGVIKDQNPDPRNYKISQFIPGQDIIEDEEFMLKFPKKEIILNQESYNACVGHAFILAKQILEYNKTNKWVELDPFVLYGTRYPGEYDGEGMIPSQGAKALYKDGAYYKRDFGKREEMPMIKDTVTEWKKNNPEKVREASKYKITGYSYVTNNNAIKIALKNGMPVSAAYPIYPSFYDTKDDGIVKVPGKNEVIEGYHQMLIVGWTKGNYWIVVNSWGKEYGFKGMYLIPFNYKYDTAISVSDTITPLKYKAKEIKFILDENKFYVDGIEKEFDVTPYMENDRIYVPVRFITESLGASVEWIDETKKVIIRSEEAIVELIIGSNKIKVNNEEKEIDVVPQIKDNRTMVPVRFVCEYLNCELNYDIITKELKINSL